MLRCPACSILLRNTASMDSEKSMPFTCSAWCACFVGELFKHERGGLGVAVGDEVPRFAGGERVLARGGLERRLFAGCVRQVPPFYSNAGRLLLRILVLRQLLNWGIYFEHRAVRAVRCGQFCKCVNSNRRSGVCQHAAHT